MGWTFGGNRLRRVVRAWANIEFRGTAMKTYPTASLRTSRTSADSRPAGNPELMARAAHARTAGSSILRGIDEAEWMPESRRMLTCPSTDLEARQACWSMCSPCFLRREDLPASRSRQDSLGRNGNSDRIRRAHRRRNPRRPGQRPPDRPRPPMTDRDEPGVRTWPPPVPSNRRGARSSGTPAPSCGHRRG